MSTSDGGATGLLVPAGSQSVGTASVTDDLEAPRAPLPGLAEIARMANELFSLALVQSAPDPILHSTPSAALVRPMLLAEGQPRAPTTPAPTDAPVAPQEGDFRAIPGSLAGLLGLAASNLVSTPAPVPTASADSLYFVQEVPHAHGANPDLSSLNAPASPAVGNVAPVGQPPAAADLSWVPGSLSSPMSSPLPDRNAIGTDGTKPPDTSVPLGADLLPKLSVPSVNLEGPLKIATAVPASASPFVPGESFEFAPELVPELSSTARPFDPLSIRRDFPILRDKVNGRPLIWLDNAATTQKPQAVIDRISEFYEHENSNIHRGAHALAARATDAFEAARDKVRRFINASTDREIVFVRGTTEGINLVAQSWGRRYVEPGDEIVISWLEHHANIVPWQQLCSEKGARLRVAPVDDRGQVILEEYEKLLGSRTKIVSFSQVSNALGTITPAREMIEMAHRHGALVLLDGAQAVSHMRVDVQQLDCDFFVFSGHKIFGPTGIGAVFGKGSVLDSMPPWQGGGNIIADVTFEKTVYQPAPLRFEAGTGNIADAVGLGAALDYVTKLGIENVSRYEHELLEYATAKLQTVPGLSVIGTAEEKAGVISFVLDGCRTEDVGAALDREGIAVRAGHHCAQPILRRFGLESTVRPSLAPYNTCEDIETLVTALLRLQADSGQRGL